MENQETPKPSFATTIKALLHGWKPQDLKDAPSSEALQLMAKQTKDELHEQALGENETYDEGFKKGSTDSLTGLPLRHIFERDLAEKIKNGLSLKLVIVDIDYLAFWNLSRFGGHAGGDNIIKQTVAILKATGAQAYRLGGEEFGLIFKEGQASSKMEEAARQVKEIEVEDTNIRPGIAFGIATLQEAEEIVNQLSEQSPSEEQKITALKQVLHLLADYRCLANKITARLILLASLPEEEQPDFFAAATKGLEGLDYKQPRNLPAEAREQKAKEMVRKHFEEILAKETDPLRRQVLNKIIAELNSQTETQN